MFAALFFLILSTQAWAQYAITSAVPVTVVSEPETTGGLFKVRLGLQTSGEYKVTYTQDTGPWPPDFSHPSSEISPSGLGIIHAGVFSFLDLLIVYSKSLEWGGQLQLIGDPQSALRPGVKLSVLGFYKPEYQYGETHSNGCFIFNCKREGRDWQIHQSSERLGVLGGYRFNEHLQVFGQYFYQRYRASGDFNKYDESIPDTYARHLDGSGEAPMAGVGAVYEFSVGKTQLAFTGTVSQIRVTSDVVDGASSTLFLLSGSFWFGKRDGAVPHTATRD